MSEKAEQEEFKSPEPKKKKIKKAKVDRVSEDQELKTDAKAFELVLKKTVKSEVKHENEIEMKHENGPSLSQCSAKEDRSTKREDMDCLQPENSKSVDSAGLMADYTPTLPDIEPTVVC